MILDNPLFRLVLKAISTYGLIGSQPDSVMSRGTRDQQRDSPFVLVAGTADARWGVFQQDFEKPLAAFDELQEACDYAGQLAKTRTDSMVLIGKRRVPAADRNSSMAEGTI